MTGQNDKLSRMAPNGNAQLKGFRRVKCSAAFCAGTFHLPRAARSIERALLRGVAARRTLQPFKLTLFIAGNLAWPGLG